MVILTVKLGDWVITLFLPNRRKPNLGTPPMSFRGPPPQRNSLAMEPNLIKNLELGIQLKVVSHFRMWSSSHLVCIELASEAPMARSQDAQGLVVPS